VNETNSHFEEPHAIPRPLTRGGARRAWGDLRVRFWWLCALALTVAMLGIASSRVAANFRERDLIANGTKVTATVVGMDGSTRVGWTQARSDSHEVRLRVKMPDGQATTLAGTLAPGLGVVKIGGELEIKFDPNQPSRWTDRTEPLSWPAELVIPLSLLPIVILLLGMAAFRRSQVLKVWREGELVQGIVHEVRHSAIAPRSRLVRYTIPEVADHRIFSALIPTSTGIPEEGETLEIIAIPNVPQRSVVAKLYAQ
jgi:hypothetical protein